MYVLIGDRKYFEAGEMVGNLVTVETLGTEKECQTKLRKIIEESKTMSSVYSTEEGKTTYTIRKSGAGLISKIDYSVRDKENNYIEIQY